MNDSDILVQISGGDPGGSSGFPNSTGDPYDTITISSSTVGLGINVVTHVFAHEIGHCIGLRHTDYFNSTISCGSKGGNEGDAGVGAIHIPGTPATTNIDLNSIMIACFNGFESGEFSNYDITALEYLYPD